MQGVPALNASFDGEMGGCVCCSQGNDLVDDRIMRLEARLDRLQSSLERLVESIELDHGAEVLMNLSDGEVPLE